MVEMNVCGYLGQLKMDGSGDRKNPGARKCYKCGSPDHYKKECSKKRHQVATVVVKISTEKVMRRRNGRMRISAESRK